MDAAEFFIILGTGIGFALGLGVGTYQCKKKFDDYVRRIFVHSTPEEMMKIRKATRELLGLRGK